MKNNSLPKLSVGYPSKCSISFFDSILPYLNRIGEVYFGWDFASGRAMLERDSLLGREIRENDLLKFSKAGIRLNLLLNGNCYGERAVSKDFANELCNSIQDIVERFGLQSVTTASPFIAHTIKKNFPTIDVRASVNMWVDGIDGMSQCSDVFDSFYVKRDYNYCIDEIEKEYKWCHENGKKLYLLANSGCIPNCAYHIFHDNWIAHSKDIKHEERNTTFEPYVCRKQISNPENRYLLLSGNLIRPEDIASYDGIIDGVKVATRVHPFPAILIRAYARGEWDGELTALTEPGFSDVIYPTRLSNTAIPEDYWQIKTSCLRAKNHGSSLYCKECGYCTRLYKSISEN